jgi:hypothetical protein
MLPAHGLAGERDYYWRPKEYFYAIVADGFGGTDI